MEWLKKHSKDTYFVTHIEAYAIRIVILLGSFAIQKSLPINFILCLLVLVVYLCLSVRFILTLPLSIDVNIGNAKKPTWAEEHPDSTKPASTDAGSIHNDIALSLCTNLFKISGTYLNIWDVYQGVQGRLIHCHVRCGLEYVPWRYLRSISMIRSSPQPWLEELREEGHTLWTILPSWWSSTTPRIPRVLLSTQDISI